ncbi:MAG: hypothetical protein QN163_10375 [Armatimonadota bacterium]|nr:hypothetical protein [Armatimonadota bacterium]MDR5696165.1 hypothetical protein [Armatimonadota bacterium]
MHRLRADEWIWDEERSVLRFVNRGEVVAEVALTGDALDLWRKALEAGTDIDEVVAEARARTEPEELQKID